MTAIAESVFARSISSQRELRAETNRVFSSGVDENLAEVPYAEEGAQQTFVEDVRKALYASKLVAYAQGLDMLVSAAEEYGWDLDLKSIASLWRAGCIIRADLLDTIMKAYDAAPEDRPKNLLLAEEFTEAINECLPPGAGWSPPRRPMACRRRCSPPLCPTTTACAVTACRLL